MTESDWLTSNDPRAMLDRLLNGRLFGADGKNLGKIPTSDRKLRLFACACARHTCTIHPEREPIAEAEECADTGRQPSNEGAWTICIEDAQRAAEGVAESLFGIPRDEDFGMYQHVKAALLREVFGNPFRPVVLPRTKAQVLKERATVHGCCNRHADNQGCTCLKEAPESIPWLTPTVLAIAQTIYSERRFEDMPILGDALEEVVPLWWACGCGWRGQREGLNDSPSGCLVCPDCGASGGLISVAHPIIAHLRSPGPHCLGCWVLDTILGKE